MMFVCTQKYTAIGGRPNSPKERKFDKQARTGTGIVSMPIRTGEFLRKSNPKYKHKHNQTLLDYFATLLYMEK